MTRPPVDVRQARPGDADDLLGLWIAARAEVQGSGRPLLGPAPEVLRPRLVEALAHRDDLRILLARWEGRPAGFAVVRVGQLLPVLEADCAQLEHLFVTAELRRQGIARALLGGVATVAERAGADQILTGAPPSARDAHRFLARLGFTPLVLRRVAATATLRRRLAGEGRRSALEDLLSRRRSLRARSARAATPPGGIPLEGGDIALAPQLRTDLPPEPAATLEIVSLADGTLDTLAVQIQTGIPGADAAGADQAGDERPPVPAPARSGRRRVRASVRGQRAEEVPAGETTPA